MGLLNKVLSRENKVDDSDAMESKADAPASETVDTDIEGQTLGPDGPDAIDEAKLLAQYSNMTPSDTVEVATTETGDALDIGEDESEAESDENGGDEGGDDLMDIFTAEADEDADLAVITEGLEELDLQALLAQAIDVSAELRELVEPE